jgi:hypothetical protein
MKILTKKEQMFVAGGLPLGPGDPGYPGPGGGIGGGGGGGSGSSPTSPHYGPNNPLLGMPSVERMAEKAGLVNFINSHHITVEEAQDPNASLGSASADVDHNIMYFPSSLINDPNVTVGDIVETGEHEQGHFEHAWDRYPTDYLEGSAYTNTALTNEGWAQMQAIQAQQTLADQGVTVQIPGDSNLAQEETEMYVNGKANGYSDSTIASNLGFVIGGQPLTAGEMYLDYWNYAYVKYWDSAQGIPLPPPPEGAPQNPYNIPFND